MQNYKTRDLHAFIQQQNQTVFDKIGIVVQADRDGKWIEFLLKNDEQMFEEEIAERREKIFKDKDNQAIEEMKQILNDYSKEKAEQEKKEAAAAGQQ